MTIDLLNISSEKTIIAFGDSNTTNANWERNQYPTEKKWTQRLSVKVRPHAVLDKGIGGNTTLDGLHRLERDVLHLYPDIVLIMFGTNDAVIGIDGVPKVKPELFKLNVQFFIKAIKEIHAIPILMTTIPLIEGNGDDGYYYSRHPKENYAKLDGARAWLNGYNLMTRQIAKENDVLLIDHWARFIEIAGGEHDHTLIQSGLFDASGTHMTPKGAEVIVHTICSELKIDKIP